MKYDNFKIGQMVKRKQYGLDEWRYGYIEQNTTDAYLKDPWCLVRWIDGGYRAYYEIYSLVPVDDENEQALVVLSNL